MLQSPTGRRQHPVVMDQCEVWWAAAAAPSDGADPYDTAPRGLKASSCSKKGALSREERRHAAAPREDQTGGPGTYLTDGEAPQLYTNCMHNCFLFYATRGESKCSAAPRCALGSEGPRVPGCGWGGLLKIPAGLETNAAGILGQDQTHARLGVGRAAAKRM